MAASSSATNNKNTPSSSSSSPWQLTWTRLHPLPDPSTNDGDGASLSPLARSSHGVSIVQSSTTTSSSPLLILYGGEHVARTPITTEPTNGSEAAQCCCWVLALGTVPLQWRCIAVDAANGPPPRVAHAQAVCGDKLYVFGGRAGIDMHEAAMNDLWCLDCTTWQWQQQHTNGMAPEARSFHRMVCVDRSLYVFGGCGAHSGRLADLHALNVDTMTWQQLPHSDLSGRGGPNVVALPRQKSLLVLAGFAGHETCDGQVFDFASNAWHEKSSLAAQLESVLRPRSVCVAGAVSHDTVVIFGGEVDPSDRGHEGAGGFQNDVVMMTMQDDNGRTGGAAGRHNITVWNHAAPPAGDDSWPAARGWASGDVLDDELYMFGGLSGDDAEPIRLDDLWVLRATRK